MFSNTVYINSKYVNILLICYLASVKIFRVVQIMNSVLLSIASDECSRDV